METKSLIQSSAKVITVTNLKRGDVFKYVNDKSSYSTEIYYGAVLDLLNSGEKTFIQVLLYQKSYSNIDCKVETWKGTEDIAIFPCTIEEVAEYFSDAVKRKEEDIVSKEKDLGQLKRAVDKAKEFLNGELSKNLSLMSYQELSQSEYNEQKIRKAIKGEQ